MHYFILSCQDIPHQNFSEKTLTSAETACNHERIIRSDLKPEVDVSLHITCWNVMIKYCITKSYHLNIFDRLVLKLQDTETETLKPHDIHVYKGFG